MVSLLSQLEISLLKFKGLSFPTPHPQVLALQLAQKEFNPRAASLVLT